MGNRVVCTICPTENGHPSRCPLSLKQSDGGGLAMKAGSPAASAAAHSTGAVKK